MDAYKKNEGDWSVYEDRFLDLLSERKAENSIPRDLLDRGCLLCSEDKPDQCHRRLVAEYFHEKFGNIEMKRIV